MIPKIWFPLSWNCEKLHAERDEVYKKIGERLWNLKRAAELSDLENMLFASLLSAAEKLTTKIIEKENEAEKVSLIV